MGLSRYFAFLAAALAFAGSAQAATLVDGSTPGLYNQAIGRSLNLTNPYGTSYFKFPDHETGEVHTFGPGDAPDLSTASAALGNWLTDPANPGGKWSTLAVSIPFYWKRHTETAIIYAIDAGKTGLTNVIGSFGVDNGLYVWLNGVFMGGYVSPGEPVPNDWTLSFGDLAPGLNYLQILREDHGVSDGYYVDVAGDIAAVPLPASAVLMVAGLGGFAAFRRRKAA